MASESHILTVGEIRDVLARWSDEAEVWTLDGQGRMLPVRGTSTFGPDSTGSRDGLCLNLFSVEDPTGPPE